MDVSQIERIATNRPIQAAGPGRVGRLRAAAAVCAVLMLGACAGGEQETAGKSKSWIDDTPLAFLRDLPAWAGNALSDGKEADSPASERADADKEAAAMENAAKGDVARGGKSAAPAPRTKPQVAALTPAPGATPKATPPAPPEAPALDPKTLVGLDEREVARVLGLPDNVRTKPPATVWSYKQKNCTFELFFYLDIATDRHRVLAYEVESARGTEETKKVCLGRIIQSALRTN